MAHQVTLTDAAANAGIGAVTALLDGGYLKIYAGARPASANAALGGATPLGRCVGAGEARLRRVRATAHGETWFVDDAEELLMFVAA